MKTKIYAIPGTFCNETMWSELEKSLPSNIELINIDMPEKDSVSEIVEVLAEQLPKEPSLLIGFSFGGYLMSAFALKYPQRVEKLLVISDALNKLSDEDVSGRKQFVDYTKSEGFSGISQEMASGALHPNRINDTQLHEKIMVMSQSMSAESAQKQMLATTTREDINRYRS